MPITETGTHTLRILDLHNTRRGAYSVRLNWLLPLAKPCNGTTPTMALDKTSLRFGAVTTGVGVRVADSGADRAADADRGRDGDVDGDAEPAVAAGQSRVGDWVGEFVGQRRVGRRTAGGRHRQPGRSRLTLTGASNTPGPIAVSLNLIPNGTSASPFGVVDTPLDNTTG